MSPVELVAILALTIFAVYKQTAVGEVTREGRFKTAIIYTVVAVVVGGFAPPVGADAWWMLLAGFALSVVVGVSRGCLTLLWAVADGRVLRKGTPLTIALFLGLIAAKFVLGAVASIDHIHDGAGFGEVMAMIAMMVAAQEQIMWLRGRRLVEAQRDALRAKHVVAHVR